MHTRHGLLAFSVVGSILFFTTAARAENCPDCGAKAPQKLLNLTGPHACDAAASIVVTEEKIDHLHKAAEHLQAAGLIEEAELVRTRAQLEQQTWRRKLLAQKISQLHQLENEIKQLKSTLDPGAQVLLHVKILEVSLDKLHEHGARAADLQEFMQAAMACQHSSEDDAPASCVLGDNSALLAYLDTLSQHGAAKMLAEPSLITLNGQRASIAIGGEIAVAGADHAAGRYESVMHEFGTRLHCTPELTDDGGLRLQFSLRQTGLPLTHAHDENTAAKAPHVLMDGDVNVKLLPGQTLVLCGPQIANDDDASTGVLVVVSPEIIAPVAHLDESGDADAQSRNAAITRWLLKRWPTVAPASTIKFHNQKMFLGPPLLQPAAKSPEPLFVEQPAPAMQNLESGGAIVSMAENFMNRIWNLVEPPKAEQNADLKKKQAGVYIRGVGVLPANFDDETGGDAVEWAAPATSKR